MNKLPRRTIGGRRTGAKIFTFIVDTMRETCGVPPTVREIRDGTGLVSTSAVQHQLANLERDGRITVDRETSRGIRVVGAKWVFEEES